MKSWILGLLLAGLSVTSHAQVATQVTAGSLGSKNYVLNESCKLNGKGITATGTATAATRSVISIGENPTSCALTFNAIGDKYRFLVNQVSKSLAIGNCSATLAFSGVNMSGVKAYVEQNSGSGFVKVSQEVQLVNTASNSIPGAPISLSYPCGGTSVTQSSVTLESTASAANGLVADVRYGRNLNIGTVASPEVVAMVSKSGAQTIATVTYTKTSFNTEDKDTYGEWNADTFLGKRPGTYTFSGQVDFGAISAAYDTVIQCRKNNAVFYSTVFGKTGSNGTAFKNPFECTTDLNGSTDYVDIWTYQNTGSNLSLRGDDQVFKGSSMKISYLPLQSLTVTNPAIPVLPTIQKFLSGSGTYIPSKGVSHIKVRVQAGGGGGGGGNNGANGLNGGDSTFGGLITATGGGFGFAGNSGLAAGLAGSGSITSPAIGTVFPGSPGSIGIYYSGGSGAGASGGGSGGGRGSLSAAGVAGLTNSGGGGAGGGTSITANNGGGGGSGGLVEAFIYSPLASGYAYSIGTGGNGGNAGTSGYAGGAGGSGYIEVTEYYQTGAAPLLVNGVVAPDYVGTTRINTVKTVTGAYTATDQDETITANTTSADVTINLPPAASVQGKKYIIQMLSDSNRAIIDPSGTEGLCGRTTVSLRGVYDSMTIQSDGANWRDVNANCERQVMATFSSTAGVAIRCGNGGNANCMLNAGTTSGVFERVTRVGVGAYDVVTNPGVFGEPATCWGSGRDESTNNHVAGTHRKPDNTSLQVAYMVYANLDVYGTVICRGRR